jgi:hypothetical protein
MSQLAVSQYSLYCTYTTFAATKLFSKILFILYCDTWSQPVLNTPVNTAVNHGRIYPVSRHGVPTRRPRDYPMITVMSGILRIKVSTQPLLVSINRMSGKWMRQKSNWMRQLVDECGKHPNEWGGSRTKGVAESDHTFLPVRKLSVMILQMFCCRNIHLRKRERWSCILIDTRCNTSRRPWLVLLRQKERRRLAEKC